MRIELRAMAALLLVTSACAQVQVVEIYVRKPPRPTDGAVVPVYCYEPPSGWRNEPVAALAVQTDAEVITLDVVRQFQRKALELGADAVVLLGRTLQGTLIHANARGQGVAQNIVEYYALALGAADGEVAPPRSAVAGGSRTCLPR